MIAAGPPTQEYPAVVISVVDCSEQSWVGYFSKQALTKLRSVMACVASADGDQLFSIQFKLFAPRRRRTNLKCDERPQSTAFTAWRLPAESGPNSTCVDLLETSCTPCCTTSCSTSPQLVESLQQIHVNKLYNKSIENRRPTSNPQEIEVVKVRPDGVSCLWMCSLSITGLFNSNEAYASGPEVTKLEQMKTTSKRLLQHV